MLFRNSTHVRKKDKGGGGGQIMKLLAFAVTIGLFCLGSGCSNKVLVKKESCKEVFDGALLECERVKK